MKNKLLFCLVSGSFLLMNCSSDDRFDEPVKVKEKKLLLSKISSVYYDNPENPETTISTLTYNDKGEMVKSNSEDGISVFEYDTDGKPLKALYYNNNILAYTSIYKYSGDKLTSVKSVYDNPNFNREFSFTYNSVGKVTSTKLCQGENCNNPSTTTYTYIEDNISVETSSWGMYSTKRDYQYDDHVNPFHYTNSYLKLVMGGAYVMSKNNYTTEKISNKNSDGNWLQSQAITYSFQYNSEKLPTEVIGKDQNGNNYVKYNYEYILK